MYGLGDAMTSSSSFSPPLNSTLLGGEKSITAISVSIITDHPIVPLLRADVRLFSAGFSIENCDSGIHCYIYDDVENVVLN